MLEQEHKPAAGTTHAASPAVQANSKVYGSSERSPATNLVQSIIQAKMAVGPAGDRHEREADAVADRVVRSLRAQRAASLGSDRPPAAPVRRIQRIQRSAGVGAQGGNVDPDTERAVRSAVGGGAPLPIDVRARLEPAFGVDFTNVRTHEGSQATALNDRIQATAFTSGNDIFFRDGLPDTTTHAGQHLLAHELTHTIQQGANGGSSAPLALQRKSGGKKGAKGGKGAKKKPTGGQGGAQSQAPLTAEESAKRAEERAQQEQARAARAAEKERLEAEAEAARVAQEEADREQRVARGRRIWRDVEACVWTLTPTAVREKKDPKGKLMYSRKPVTALIAAAFAELKAELEAGEFDVDETDEQIRGTDAELAATWEPFLWAQIGSDLGSSAPTKAQFFAHIGWPSVKGVQWAMKALGTAPSGHKVHITVSGNSMISPQTLVQQDPGALERSPSDIFERLFEIDTHLFKVHCTRESKPKKHLYLGGKNGGVEADPTARPPRRKQDPRTIADHEWEGDAKFMREQLEKFQTDTEAKIIEAKLKGWKL